MNKKIYVGNLPYSAGDADLADTFGAYGTVESARIVTDRDSGRSKGFGFVEMATPEEAGKAIEALNGQDFMGRKLMVSEARPQEPRTGGGGGGRGGFGGGRGGGGGGGRGGFGGGRGGGGGGRRDEY
ncbi:MAG: RNA recognition motif domain-containing protein [Bdellovibrionales bacterium]